MSKVMKLTVLALAWASFSAGAVMAQQTSSPFRLIVTHLEAPLVPNSVMDLALQLGYFAEEGVEVELIRVQQTPMALAALQAGEGEMANVGVDALLQILHSGATDLRAVTSPNKSLPFIIGSKEDIASPADLAGKSFGVGRPGSLDHTLSAMVLSSMGTELADTEVVTLGQPSVRAQALTAGQIDATTMSIGVWSELPSHEGLRILVDQDAYYEAAPLVNKVNVVPVEVLEGREDEVEAVIRALVRLSRDFAANPDMWVSAMKEARPDVNVEVLESLSRSFAESWSVNGGMSAEELGFTTEWLYDTEDFSAFEQLRLDQWVDFAPVDAVLSELGVDPSMDPADR